MPEEKNVSLTRTELRELLSEAVSRTPPSNLASLTKEQMSEIAADGVRRAFVTMGIDLKHPLEMQKDFTFIRKVRKQSELLSKQVLFTAVGLCVTALITVIWLGLKAVISAIK